MRGGGGGGGGYRFDYYLLYLLIDGNERNTGVLTCMRAVGCLDDSSMVASVKMAHPLTGSMQLVTYIVCKGGGGAIGLTITCFTCL